MTKEGNKISRLRILFSVKNPEYVRHYVSVLRMLAARGHRVELAKQSPRHAWPSFVAALAAESPNIHLSTLPDVAGNPWWELATRLRQARLYLRYLEPANRATTGLRQRARKRAPAVAVRLGDAFGATEGGRRLLGRAVDLLEQATRSATLFYRYLDRQRPDVVVLTPLVVLKTAQFDLGRAAGELGIRNVFAVASWDHLSSKAVLTFTPHRVFVWNDTLKQEAIALHSVPADRVVVTGSQVFDDWFSRAPSTTREEFCQRVGLRHDRPIVLYVCSSLLESSPPEAPFVMKWARELRRSPHPVLQDCGLLVRPHPRRGREWRKVELTGITNAVCWPPAGELPTDQRSKTDYFDSMYHADAVVGLNTSAMIEAAILGRPVHTVLLPEFRESQEETVHFHYLLDGPDALLRSTRSLGEHARDLAAVLEHGDRDRERSARFVRAFVRPCGVDVPATTVLVNALEAIAQDPAPARKRASVWASILRPLLWPFAAAAARRVRRIRDEHRSRKHAELAEHRRRKAAATVDNMTVP